MATETTVATEALKKFVETWGTMGSMWGINASTARVHALLIASDDPLSLDEIAKHLKISRGNASMCLKELRNWDVIRLTKQPGDRRDYYVSESDAWKMFFAIIRERKRREFDPLVNVVKETLDSLREGVGSNVQPRLKRMEELLNTLNQISTRLLANEKTAHSVLLLLTGFSNVEKE